MAIWLKVYKTTLLQIRGQRLQIADCIMEILIYHIVYMAAPMDEGKEEEEKAEAQSGKSQACEVFGGAAVNLSSRWR